MVYDDKIIFKTNIYFAVIFGIIISFLSISFFLGSIFKSTGIGSIGFGILIMSIIYFYLLAYSDKYTLIAAKFWEDKIEIFYPLHIKNRKIVLSYQELEYLFFRRTYMGRSIILIYKDRMDKSREVVIECSQPYYINKIINHSLKSGVKSGIDINSYDYAGLKSSLPNIKIDKTY